MSYIDLTGCNFNNAKIEDCLLPCARLDGASLNGASLTNNRIHALPRLTCGTPGGRQAVYAVRGAEDYIAVILNDSVEIWRFNSVSSRHEKVFSAALPLKGAGCAFSPVFSRSRARYVFLFVHTTGLAFIYKGCLDTGEWFICGGATLPYKECKAIAVSDVFDSSGMLCAFCGTTEPLQCSENVIKFAKLALDCKIFVNLMMH